MKNTNHYQMYLAAQKREFSKWVVKLSITLTILTLFVATLQAQDLIMKIDGDEIKAKVLEIGDSEIKYKRFDNEDGPSYSISKSEVFVIKYANGTKELMGGKVSSAPIAPAQTPAPILAPAPANYSKANLSISMEGFKFYHDNIRVMPKDVSRVMTKNGVPDAAKSFEDGLKLYPSVSRALMGLGIPFFLIGTACAIGGAVMISSAESSYASSSSYYSYSDYESRLSTGSTLMTVGIPVGVIGLGSWITGGVLKGVGLRKIRNSVEKYNASVR